MGTKSLWALSGAWIVFLVAAMSVIAYGDPSIEPVTDAPSFSEWLALYHSLGDLKGVSTLGGVTIAVQALLLFTRSSFDPLPGPQKLVVVTGLTMILGVVSMKMTTNVSWGVALLHSTVLANIQVFGNQVYQQFFLTPAQRNLAAKDPPKAA